MSTPVLEGTDYPSLTGGHRESSCTDISIVGLHVKVYGLNEIEGSKLPIAAVVSSFILVETGQADKRR